MTWRRFAINEVGMNDCVPNFNKSYLSDYNYILVPQAYINTIVCHYMQ